MARPPAQCAFLSLPRHERAALPAPGTTDLLAAAGSMLTAWQLTSQPARWTQTQTIKVPIQYGSSSGS